MLSLLIHFHGAPFRLKPSRPCSPRRTIDDSPRPMGGAGAPGAGMPGAGAGMPGAMPAAPAAMPQRARVKPPSTPSPPAACWQHCSYGQQISLSPRETPAAMGEGGRRGQRLHASRSEQTMGACLPFSHTLRTALHCTVRHKLPLTSWLGAARLPDHSCPLPTRGGTRRMRMLCAQHPETL